MAYRIGLAALFGAALVFLAACGSSSGDGENRPTGPTGLTLYDSLGGSALDGTKWQTPLFSYGVTNGAMVLSTQVSNMESRTIQGRVYATTANVNAGAQRVTTLKADLTVPATASRTGNAQIRAHVQLSYQPPANRLNFPGGNLDAVFVQMGLVDSGSGLRAYRRVLHNDNPSSTNRSTTGIAFVDPAGFTPNGFDAEAAAAYDTTYTVGVSLDESTGVFTWSIAGGTFGAEVSGTADPSAYLAGNANWTAMGANPLAGAGFLVAFLRTQSADNSALAGSDASMGASFGNVQVGFNNAAAILWDDFSGTGTNSGPTELRGLKWSAAGGSPSKASMALSAGSLVGHAQATSFSTNGISNFQALTFNNPAALNTLQADVTVSACSNSFASGGASNRVQLQGNFYNDGFAGSTPPNTNQPNSPVGDIRAFLMLDCVTDQAIFEIIRFNTTVGGSLLSSTTNNTVPKNGAVTGSTHTLSMSWNPVTHAFTFQVDSGTPVVVDPTTTNARMNVAAPFVKAANSPQKQLAWGVLVPTSGGAVGATASIDFRVNNVFTAP